MEIEEEITNSFKFKVSKDEINHDDLIFYLTLFSNYNNLHKFREAE